MKATHSEFGRLLSKRDDFIYLFQISDSFNDLLIFSIYTGLVELMAHEFMFNQEMRKSSIKMVLFAFGCMCLGAGLMALLGKWA